MEGLEWPCNYKKMVMGELIKGREFAHKLRNMLQKQVDGPSSSDGSSSSSSAQELVTNILRSFSDTLSVLSNSDDDQYSGEVGHQISTVAYVGSACSVDRMPECSGESRKSPAAGRNDRRGCYKRRKRSDTRIIVAPVVDDEYTWRKYGQKEILHAKFPRCYFRCTYKYDQGCKAVKQVQKMDQDDSNMYQITYFGNHTCKNIGKPTQMFQEPPDLTNTYLLSFESKEHMSTNTMKRSDHHDPHHNRSVNHVPTIFPPLVKEEPKQFKQSTTELSDDNLSCADSNLWKEIIALGSSDHDQNIDQPPIMGFHYDDVVSSVQYSGASTSSHGFDMEFLLKSVDDQFDGEFPFGEIE